MDRSMINMINATWVLFSSSLVLFMICGLAFFYGGLVSTRNVMNTINMSFICLAIIPVIWILVGYSLAFTGTSPWIGSFSEFGLMHLSRAFDVKTLPAYVYMIFQMMFATISPAIISGAVVERIKFNAYMLFIAIWSILVYCSVAHWVWSDNGWLKTLGVLDFAGGMVVHLTAGCSALIAAIILKPRKVQNSPNKGQHLPYVILGASILFFGWFGFNAGSSLEISIVTVIAFVNTALGAASSMLAWTLLNVIFKKKSSVIGTGIATVIGLVAITPACGYVSHISSIWIGLSAATICFFSLEYKYLWAKKIDDTLDVFVCHGVAAIVGCLLTGVFCSAEINPSISDGVIGGNFKILGAQIVGIVFIAFFSIVMTFIILKFIGIFIRIRIDSNHEHLGLDAIEHGESFSD